MYGHAPATVAPTTAPYYHMANWCSMPMAPVAKPAKPWKVVRRADGKVVDEFRTEAEARKLVKKRNWGFCCSVECRQ